MPPLEFASDYDTLAFDETGGRAGLGVGRAGIPRAAVGRDACPLASAARAQTLRAERDRAAAHALYYRRKLHESQARRPRVMSSV